MFFYILALVRITELLPALLLCSTSRSFSQPFRSTVGQSIEHFFLYRPLGSALSSPSPTCHHKLQHIIGTQLNNVEPPLQCATLDHRHSSSSISSFKTEYSVLVINLLSFILNFPALIFFYISPPCQPPARGANMSASPPLFTPTYPLPPPTSPAAPMLLLTVPLLLSSLLRRQCEGRQRWCEGRRWRARGGSGDDGAWRIRWRRVWRSWGRKRGHDNHLL
jgi:hypothetical protein